MKPANIHPEGSAHPRPPKLVSAKASTPRPAFSKKVYDQFSLTKDLFPYHVLESVLFDKNLRQRYTEFATRWLQGHTSRENQHSSQWIIIGAGIHGALAHRELLQYVCADDILILERSKTPCASMQALSTQLILNSPTFTKVGLNSNHIPNGDIQLTDFDELQERPFPRAEHLYQLTTIMLFHQQARVYFETEVLHISSDSNGHVLTTNSGVYKAQNVLVATGPGFNRKMGGPLSIDAEKWIVQSKYRGLHQKLIKDKTIAVIGAGDYANNVMETLLPLIYPHEYYQLENNPESLPKKIYWIGQNAQTIQDFYLNNKSRYCHSGALIEYFWGEESPFELSTKIWKKTRHMITPYSDRALKIEQKGSQKTITLENGQSLEADIVIEAIGQRDPFKELFPLSQRETVCATIEFQGGYWDDRLELFTHDPQTLTETPIAQKVINHSIYFLGLTNELNSLIPDEEARNGALNFNDDKKSLSNSKWSLEHTLPRTFALIHHLLQS